VGEDEDEYLRGRPTKALTAKGTDDEEGSRQRRPSNRLEALKGDQKGRHSIRVNDKNT
jgi:plasmid maintenance system killer protein